MQAAQLIGAKGNGDMQAAGNGDMQAAN